MQEIADNAHPQHRGHVSTAKAGKEIGFVALHAELEACELALDVA